VTLEGPRGRLLLALGAVVALLVLATVIVEVLRRARPARDWTELVQRVRSWWVMVGVFALAVLLHRAVTLAFFAGVSALALREYLALVPRRDADRRAVLWLYLAIPLQYLWVGLDWYGMFIVFVPVYVFLGLPVRMLVVGETRGYLAAVGTLHWGAMITIFGLSHAAALLALPASVNPAAGGAGLLLFVVALTQLNDVAQFCWGKLVGRRPVAPRVSPRKTVGGLVGGVATTVLLSWLAAPYLTPLSPREALLAGALIGLGGFVGDLNISAIKRDLGRKDAGDLIPGHGGILDRVDSLSYTAPLFLHLVRYLHG